MHLEGPWIKDDQGRTLILRGVNLGGSSKVPAGRDGATHDREAFFDQRNVSFVGRPFPLEEADEHFSRLRAWGLSFVRLVVTWEAIEHAGPGIYDEAYLEYIREVVERANSYGIELFIDPHQDAWGRMCGGDGAPGWTFEAVGMDVARFAETGAAIIHCIHGEPFCHMCWATNYTKLAAATMFTLFFGGNDFATETKVAGEPVQSYLQSHYFGALRQLARRLEGLPNVVGYGTMNEPSRGYIGQSDLRRWDRTLKLRLRESPTPYEGMLLGAGMAQKVAVFGWRLAGFSRLRHRVIDPGGVGVWREGHDDVWRANGVWDVDSSGIPRLLRPDHFVRAPGPGGQLRHVEFADMYLRPFANRFAREIRSVAPKAIIFVEGMPNDALPHWGPDDAPNIVHSAHWYDGLTVLFRRFFPFVAADTRHGRFVLGQGRAQRSREEQLAYLKRWAAQEMGGVPTVISEFGIPLNLDEGQAYRTGDFSRQIQALDAGFRALDANLLGATLWNYTADNDNHWGDQWNNEDYSIFSRDQQAGSVGAAALRQSPVGTGPAGTRASGVPSDINAGGRALTAVVRPYPRRTAGQPLRLSFDIRRGCFEYQFQDDPEVAAPTEIYVPDLQYGEGYVVDVSDGTYQVDRDQQTILYRHEIVGGIHTIRISRRGQG